MSLNGALATASRSLSLFSLGIQVAGHNLANAATPGYVRDALVTVSSPPYRQGGVLVGTGANALGVRQQLDAYLESRIYAANTDYMAADVRKQGYLELQTAIQELGSQDLSTSLNNFISTVQNAVNQPDDPALRSLVIQQGAQFATDARQLRARVEQLQAAYSDKMKSLVSEANTLLDKINQLNPQISQLEANGLDQNDAGSLRVQRLNALQRLSEIMPIRVQELPSGAVDVFSGSDYLILDGHSQHLETVAAPTSSGVATVGVQLSQTGSQLAGAGGELGGLVESRDRIFGGFLEQLDLFVGGAIFEFNRIHAGGEGLRGYQSVTSDNGVADTTAALNAAGLAFTPTHGSFDLKVRNTATGAVETSNLAIDLDGIGADTSLDDLRAAIDGLNHVTATIDPQGRLQITADAGYEVRFGNDTSGVLASLGINNFFTGSDSGDIAVSSALVNDQRYFAAGQGGGPADNSNAVRLAAAFDQPVDGLGGLSVDEFHTQLIGSIAQAGSAESALADGFQGFRDSLKTQREQRSGVNVDEEAINMMALQRNYQAAARIISTIDQLLNVLLQV